MIVFFVIISIIAFIAGFGSFLTAKSVLHQIFGGVLFIISSLFFCSAGIIDEIKRSRNKQTELLTEIKDELRRLRLKKYPDKRPDS